MTDMYVQKVNENSFFGKNMTFKKKTTSFTFTCGYGYNF